MGSEMCIRDRSYTYGVLARAFLGTATMYLITSWPIGFNFSFRALQGLFKFGVPYQLNSLLAVVKDKVMILLLGKVIGHEGIAIIGWAEKWAKMPLRYFLDNTARVAFPTFARIQSNKRKLKNAVEKVVYFLAVLIFPSLFGLGLVAGPLVKVIPRYLKWQPALVPLYLYSFASVWGGFSVILTTIFNAIGKIKITFKLMILWTVLSWLFTPILALKMGFVGVPIAVILVNISSVVGFWILRKYTKF